MDQCRAITEEGEHLRHLGNSTLTQSTAGNGP